VLNLNYMEKTWFRQCQSHYTNILNTGTSNSSYELTNNILGEQCHWLCWNMREDLRFSSRKFAHALLSLLGCPQQRSREVYRFPNLLFSFPRPSCPAPLYLSDRLFQPRNHRPERWSKSWSDPLKQSDCSEFIETL